MHNDCTRLLQRIQNFVPSVLIFFELICTMFSTFTRSRLRGARQRAAMLKQKPGRGQNRFPGTPPTALLRLKNRHFQPQGGEEAQGDAEAAAVAARHTAEVEAAAAAELARRKAEQATADASEARAKQQRLAAAEAEQLKAEQEETAAVEAARLRAQKHEAVAAAALAKQEAEAAKAQAERAAIAATKVQTIEAGEPQVQLLPPPQGDVLTETSEFEAAIMRRVSVGDMGLSIARAGGMRCGSFGRRRARMFLRNILQIRAVIDDDTNV
eukprot:SAG11_NODE_469_length_9207_cov_5.391744_12_plen_269_part_00